MYLEDLSSIFFKILLIILFIAFLFLQKSVLLQIKDFEFLLLMYICMFASCFILNVNDLMLFFFLLELQSLTIYILVASSRKSNFSTEAALKYFITGSFASGLILFGISLIYGFSGLTNFLDLSCFSHSLYLIKNTNEMVFYGYLFGVVILIIGIFFKLGVVPFHMWMPDAYDGASFVVMSFISTLPKIPIVYFLVKFFGYFLADVFFFYQGLLLFVSFMSIF